MDDNKPQRVRRERYKGTHPKKFKEKYKELQPEAYSADIEKVMQQGRTPAGMHRSICVNEIMEFLAIVPGQTGLDATLGYGGHSLEMLRLLVPINLHGEVIQKSTNIRFCIYKNPFPPPSYIFKDSKKLKLKRLNQKLVFQEHDAFL